MQEELEEVISWLEAGDAADYQAGVLLLQRRCKNRALVAHLLRKDSAGNREKLRYELVKVGCGGRMADVSEVLNHFAQAVRDAVPAVAAVLVEAHAQVPAFPEQSAPAEVPEAARPDVDAVTELMGRLYNERVQLSNRLADLDPAAGAPVVAQILSLQDQYNALAQKRRNLAGQPAPAQPAGEPAPVEVAPVAIDRAELQQRRGNLRSNISKAKAKVGAAQSDAKRAELQEKVAKWEAELSNVELQLILPQ